MAATSGRTAANTGATVSSNTAKSIFVPSGDKSCIGMSQSFCKMAMACTRTSSDFAVKKCALPIICRSAEMSFIAAGFSAGRGTSRSMWSAAWASMHCTIRVATDLRQSSRHVSKHFMYLAFTWKPKLLSSESNLLKTSREASAEDKPSNRWTTASFFFCSEHAARNAANTFLPPAIAVKIL